MLEGHEKRSKEEVSNGMEQKVKQEIAQKAAVVDWWKYVGGWGALVSNGPRDRFHDLSIRNEIPKHLGLYNAHGAHAIWFQGLPKWRE